MEEQKKFLPIGNLINELGFVTTINKNFSDQNLSGILGLNANCKYGKNYPDKLIVVNGNDNVSHQRLTVAHELAHYIFDTIDGQEYYEAYYIANKNQDNVIREYRANKFAANLLMPALIFIKQYQLISSAVDNKDITAAILAQDFAVSITAVKKRIKELDL